MTATPQMQGAWEAPILWIGERPQPRGTCRHGRRGHRYVPAKEFPPKDILNRAGGFSIRKERSERKAPAQVQALHN